MVIETGAVPVMVFVFLLLFPLKMIKEDEEDEEEDKLASICTVFRPKKAIANRPETRISPAERDF